MFIYLYIVYLHFQNHDDLAVYHQLICGSQNICSNSPILNGRLPFSLGSSRSHVYFWNLPFWDDPGLNVRYLWILQVHHTFYKLDVKILDPSNEIRCMHCSWPPTSHEQWNRVNKSTYCFATSEKSAKNEFENQFCNF